MSNHEDKMLQLQFQMRENQTELQEYLKGLDSWESDIKTKDEKLKTDKQSSEAAKLPPVRNSLLKKRRKKVVKQEANQSGPEGKVTAKPKRINSYDYRAWDKFVAEKTEESDEEERKSESSDYETDEEWETERKKQVAILEKDKGNQLFKEGQFDQAIECYSKGGEMDPSNPLLPANRAMALLKQDKFAAAEVDCTMALTLDPTYVKAYLRRGAARMGLEETEKAKKDFERALQLEPKNKTALSELRKIEKTLMKEKEERLGSRAEAGFLRAVHKEPKHRSKKPLRRLEIEEIGVNEDETKSAIAKAEASQSPTKRIITEKDNTMFEKFTENSAATMAAGAGISLVTDDTRIPVIEELSTHAENDNTSIEKPSSKKVLSSLRTVSSPSTSPQSSPRLPDVPQNSYQFQADWKILKNHSESVYQYVKKIPPDDYPKLFGQALESDMLTKLMTVIKDFYIPAELDTYRPLHSLTKVKRFSMTAMFMSMKEKQVVQEIVDHMRMEAKVESSQINSLAKEYGVR